jgi:hypothetical protein
MEADYWEYSGIDGQITIIKWIMWKYNWRE